jgi:cellulose synthase/poly-beta-1,6-N-acetylglucosamine synthase-like glycosyltransferase
MFLKLEGDITMNNIKSYDKFSFLSQSEIKQHRVLRHQYTTLTEEQKKVSIIVSTNKEIYFENIISNYTQQNYLNKELIIILNNNSLKVKEWLDLTGMLQNVQIYQLDETFTLGECLNYAVDKSSGSFIAKFDDDDYYGPNYLIDMVFGFTYSTADIIGKASQFVYFKKSKTMILCHPGSTYQYLNIPISGGPMVIKRRVFDYVRFRPLSIGEDDFFKDDCFKNGLKMYTVDPFNYIIFRRSEKAYHTWKIDDETYLTWGIPIASFSSPKEFVTI